MKTIAERLEGSGSCIVIDEPLDVMWETMQYLCRKKLDNTVEYEKLKEAFKALWDANGVNKE